MSTPTQYRMLEAGEVIQEGDEYALKAKPEEWRKTTASQWSIPLPECSVGLFRRPVESIDSVPELKTIIRVLADRCEWAIKVFEANGNATLCPWHSAQEWVKLTKEQVAEARIAETISSIPQPALDGPKTGLTLTDLNIAICEWLGWWKASSHSNYWCHPDDETCEELFTKEGLPSHLSGPTALGNLHEAEKRLTEEQREYYVAELVTRCGGWWFAISATPLQRAIALLHVVRPELREELKHIEQ